MGIVSTKLRKSAKGQPCSFQIPGICNHDADTTVLCHAPSEVKGMGNKGHDFPCCLRMLGLPRGARPASP
ncbi:nuclease domain-containing protein [Ochrobactrum sp. MC-1LL]|uniref:nuclease domain-containing protein n=1 Tax=Ochrobactrum sp. MC-1LL TaxID=2735351 RepID=UPI001AEE1447